MTVSMFGMSFQCAWKCALVKGYDYVTGEAGVNGYVTGEAGKIGN